jgi:hypothetical protein
MLTTEEEASNILGDRISDGVDPNRSKVSDDEDRGGFFGERA